MRGVLSTEGAFDELVGFVPVQTFEQPMAGGAHKIGVLAVISQKMKGFAERVVIDGKGAISRRYVSRDKLE